MNKLIVARHGQDLDNARGLLNGHRDQPLTDRGVSQAHLLAGQIFRLNRKIEAIFSSPLKRAKQTAMIVAEALGQSYEIMPALIERDFGEFSGRPVAEIPNFGADLISTPDANFFLNGPGVETFEEVLIRAQGIVDFLDREFETGRVLLVCHGDVLKMIKAVRTGLSIERVLKEGLHQNCEYFIF